jgi:hypothetical protein
MNTIGYTPTVNGVSMNVLSNPNPTSGCAVYYLYVANAETNITVSLGASGPAPAHIVLSFTGTKTTSSFWEGLTSTTSSTQNLSVAAATAGDMILSIATALVYQTNSPPSNITYTDGSGQTRISLVNGTGNNAADNPSYYNAATVISYEMASTTKTVTETASPSGTGLVYVAFAILPGVTGWTAGSFLRVPNDQIASIMGVPKSQIAKVNGV